MILSHTFMMSFNHCSLDRTIYYQASIRYQYHPDRHQTLAPSHPWLLQRARLDDTRTRCESFETPCLHWHLRHPLRLLVIVETAFLRGDGNQHDDLEMRCRSSPPPQDWTMPEALLEWNSTWMGLERKNGDRDCKNGGSEMDPFKVSRWCTCQLCFLRLSAHDRALLNHTHHSFAVTSRPARSSNVDRSLGHVLDWGMHLSLLEPLWR